MAAKSYRKADLFQELEDMKSSLYNFSAKLNSLNMNLMKRDVIQAKIEDSAANLNTAIAALDKITITYN